MLRNYAAGLALLALVGCTAPSDSPAPSTETGTATTAQVTNVKFSIPGMA